MEMPDYAQFFRGYAAAYERSLGEHVEVEAIRGHFADGFVAASLDGNSAVAGANDDAFVRTMREGYAFYKAIGTQSMEVDRVAAEPLCENHDRVRVSYRAAYRKADGTFVTIPFDVVYLLQRRAGGPKIFGFITGDEMAVYRRHGLVDDAGKPAKPS
jgi:hypothetical protein